MTGRAVRQSSHAMTFMQPSKLINHPNQHSSNPLTSPTNKQSSPSASRVLEIGHVFTQHYLVDQQHVKRKVVIFVQSNTLFACEYQPNQTCYRSPVKRLVFDQTIEVLMGKQTSALRLAENAIDRRCFTIRYQSNKQPFNQTNQIELEAPGSGDVKYWLRCFLSLMTQQLSFKLHENLHFINQPVYNEQALQQCETRLRQARFDSQFARRKEESLYRYHSIARLTCEHKRDWCDRALEIDARGATFVELNSAIDRRITNAVDGPSRVRTEDVMRKDAIKRMVECRQAELQFILAVQHANSRSVKSFAAANKRSASLVTHVNHPLFHHRSANSTPVLNTRSIHSSKSHPNLPASTPPSPCLNVRRLSGPTITDAPSPPPQAQLKLLTTVLPSHLLTKHVKQPKAVSSISHYTTLSHESSSSPASVSTSHLQAPEATVTPVSSQLVTATRPQARPLGGSMTHSVIKPANPSTVSLHSVFPVALNPLFSQAYHYPASDAQRSSSRLTYATPKVSDYKSTLSYVKPYHNAFPEPMHLIPSLPMTQVYRFQSARDTFDQLALVKQAAPMPDSVGAAPTLPAAHFMVPRSTSFSIHVNTSGPAITVSVTAQDVESQCHDAPPSYESLPSNDCFSYA